MSWEIAQKQHNGACFRGSCAILLHSQITPLHTFIQTDKANRFAASVMQWLESWAGNRKNSSFGAKPPQDSLFPSPFYLPPPRRAKVFMAASRVYRAGQRLGHILKSALRLGGVIWQVLAMRAWPDWEFFIAGPFPTNLGCYTPFTSRQPLQKGTQCLLVTPWVRGTRV